MFDILLRISLDSPNSNQARASIGVQHDVVLSNRSVSPTRCMQGSQCVGNAAHKFQRSRFVHWALQIRKAPSSGPCFDPDRLILMGAIKQWFSKPGVIGCRFVSRIPGPYRDPLSVRHA